MEKQKNLAERRTQTSELINHMLDERKQLLTLLLQVSSLEFDRPVELANEVLDEFCQVLVDYIAAGHFGLYQRIVQKRERRKGVADLAMQVYPRIEETTQLALAFNEKYDLDNGGIDLSGIQEDLSQLGEELTTRIELEDQLIGELINVESLHPR